jgi:phosphatidylserine/phosphatidylglycerophosphate/cardiolipin synthase-like enzyme
VTLAVDVSASADDTLVSQAHRPGVSAREASVSAPATARISAVPGPRQKAAPKTRRYAPRPGVVFNTALGAPDRRNAVYGKIIAAISHAPARSRIRIMSWNIMSRVAVDALLDAQRRGVKVRVLMANTNLVDVPNPGFKRLRAGLKRGNQTVPSSRRSYAKTCILSCRGRRGSAHTKVFLFSKTGKAHDVVMSGSANLTVAGVINQWNDMYTWVGNRALYDFAVGVYREMWQDEPVEEQFVHRTSGKDLLGFFPMFGPDGVGRDPVRDLLDKVACHGATNTPHGRTIIRAAPDVLREERGMEIASQLKKLWAEGCDVRIAYTVMGVNVFRFLNRPTARGVVPKKHLVQDFDGDGEFDNYFHLKALTINGRWNGDRTAYVTLNGSANWTSSAMYSDENYAILKRRAPTLKYQRFIDHWYENFPRSARMDRRTARAVARGRIDPYDHVDMD